MKPPRRFLEFKLLSLNRIFCALGFVLVIAIDKDHDKPTMIFFNGRRAHDKWCEQFVKPA